MSAAIAQKRKPFGTSAENALNSKKQSIQKDVPKHDSRGGTSTRFDPNTAERRRDSKTPKKGNLTSAGYAYDLKKEFGAPPPRGSKWVQHVKTAGHRPVAKRDPSPIKRPDPTSASGKSTVLSKMNRPDKLSKRHSSTKKRDGFVAASLKRLFPSMDSSVNQPRAKTNDSDRPFGNIMRSTGEKNPTFVMSPLTKPDPIAKDEGGREFDKIEDMCVHVELNMEQPHAEPEPKSDNLGSVSFNAPSKVIQEMADLDIQPRGVSKEVLDRFRNGPTNDQGVLDAMFRSDGGRPSHRHMPVQHEASIESLIGSMVGGSSLQRSTSVDESEVTTVGYIHEDSSQASMTTRFDHVESDRHGVKYHRPNKSEPSLGVRSQNIFRGKQISNAESPYQDFCRANTIYDQNQTTSDQSLDLQTHLPAGWKVRWSKTKQQPYWVHPDFGSTWHCPGLIPTVRPKKCQQELLKKCQHKLFDYQLIFEGMQIRPSDNPRPSTAVPTHSVAYKSALTSESDTASHMWRVLGDAGNSVKSAINEYSIPINAEATFVAPVIQTNRCNAKDTFLHYADAGGSEEKRANDSKSVDVSSTESSAECFTQDFEYIGRDEDETKSVTEIYYDKNKLKQDVEFEYDQLNDHDDSVGRNYHSEETSHEPSNDDEDDVDETISQGNNDEDGSSRLDNSADTGSSSAINSLPSDYVDVDALLKNEGKKVISTLATIKEVNQSSDGYRTSEDSNDGSSSLQNVSKNLRDSFEELSDGEDTCEVDFGATSLTDNKVSIGIRVDSDEKSHVSDGYDPRAEKKKRRHSSGSYGGKKKFFPPGPLCSLQFLEEIERREFDSPLWRRMKRKRSTLASVRAQNQRQRRSSFH